MGRHPNVFELRRRRRFRLPGRGAIARRIKRPEALLLTILTMAVASLIALELLIAPRPSLHGRAYVIDGDTLRIDDQTIRLAGIDAPEKRQSCERDGGAWACGQAATLFLSRLVGAGEMSCAALGHDRYGRILGRCARAADGASINAEMVRAGYARAYTRYSLRYVVHEWQARWNGRGIWQGSFDDPEAWRRSHRR